MTGPDLTTTLAALAGMASIVPVTLGGLATNTGGASMFKGISRVTFWDALAMAITARVARLFGVAA